MSAVVDSGMLERVKKAIEVELAPNSSQQERNSARELIEALKNDSPHSASIGLTLYANFQNGVQVRYIGMQLVEDYIKRRWNTLLKSEKDTWKKEAIFLMEAIQMSEVNHIKEALVRITVEIAKREFPQNWSNFLAALGNLQAKGPAQLEMTLLVFLRLAEDVILSLDPHIQTQRRRNIEQALSENMKDIFQFFITTLQENVGAWRGNRDQVNLRLAEATLFTLLAYLQHAAMEHIFACNSVLLQMICELLNEEKLRMAAADCLFVFTERRRDRIDIRSPILVFFSEDAMGLFVDIARKACLPGAEEDEYNFLKKVCDVIANIGSCQLADIWGHDRGIRERPKCFERYIKLILDMAGHPSQVISLKAVAVYLTFLKHEQISKDGVFVDSIPFFLSVFGDRLAKVGGINEDNHPSCKYSVIDHDSTDEFLECFQKLRSSICLCVRECTSILPLDCFEHVCQKMMGLAQKQQYQQDVVLWEAMAVFADAVLSRLWRSEKVDKTSEIAIHRGKTVNVVAISNEVLRSLVEFQTTIPQVTSSNILCIQAFFPFFKRSPEKLMPALEKIMMTFTRFPLEGAVKDDVSTRRQATTSFINLCKHDSAHLLPYFGSFVSYVSKLNEGKEITHQEYYTLLEGLFVLSNGMSSNREEFIQTHLAKLDELLSLKTFERSLESTDNFVTFLGLAEIDYSASQSQDNRNCLSSFLGILLAMVRRVELKQEEKMSSASSGGFFGSAGSSWIRKIISYLPVLTQIVKHVGFIWTPDVKAKVKKEFLPAFQLNENDRLLLLGQHVTKEIKESVSSKSSLANNATTYLHNLHTQSYTLLGQIGGFLEENFYNVDGLVQLLISDVMSSWAILPKYRFTTVFKLFFKPFMLSCPVSCFDKAIAPVLSVALDSMLQFLSKEWSDYNHKNANTKAQDSTAATDDNPSDQVIEERLIFSLSREYIETLVASFFVKRKGKESITSDEDVSQPEPGELGNFILQCDATNSNYIFTMFNALAWPDTVSVNKIARVIPHIVKFISQQTTGVKIDASIIDQLFLCILKGLQTHGAELSAQGSLITSALTMYLSLREPYPSLVRIMLMIPSCKKGALMKFDLDVFEAESKLTDKKKRECFRAFLSDAFGKNLSEIHKADIKIKDLPPLAPRIKAKPPQNDNIQNLTDLFE